MKLKSTRKLRTRIGEFPNNHDDRVSIVLGDWVGNIIPIMGGELLVFINELSLLTLILPISAIPHPAESLSREVSDLLQALQVPAALIQDVQRELAAVSVVPAESKRMLSLLREVSYYCQDVARFTPPDRIRNQLDMELELAEWLHGPAPYQIPTDLLREIVESHTA